MGFNRSTSPLPVALIILVIGLLIGWMRYTELYGYPILSIQNLYYIHPHVMIFGFISLVILFERYRGVGVSREYRNALLLGIIANIIAIFILLIGSISSLANISSIGYYLLIIPPTTYILFLILNRKAIYGPVLTLHLTSNLVFILSILADITGVLYDRYIYSLLLISYPTLFILGERLELTRFVAPKKWIETLIHLSVYLYLTIFLLTFIYWEYSRYLGYLPGLPLMAIILTIITLDPTLKIRESVDIRMRYLSFHLRIGYIMLMLGILTYYLGKLGISQVNLYDTYVHLIALGFIGMMLIGHGPIILSSLLGIKVRFRYIHTYVLLLAILLRIFQNLFYLYLQPYLLIIFSILAGVLVFISLFAFLYNTVFHGLMVSRGGN